MRRLAVRLLFFFNDTATTEIYTLSLHDALPIWWSACPRAPATSWGPRTRTAWRSEEHTSELQSLRHLVCRLLLEKTKTSHQPFAKTSSRLHSLRSPVPSSTR